MGPLRVRITGEASFALRACNAISITAARKATRAIIRDVAQGRDPALSIGQRSAARCQAAPTADGN